MAYLHINNLYKDQDILLFRECYAMEKIHGTSAHISWKEGQIHFFSGGISYKDFVKLFEEEELQKRFEEIGQPEVVVFGEAYGGKCQGMSETYGKTLKFVVFEVKIGDLWLSVSQAEDIAKQLGLEFIHYRKIRATLNAIDKERNAESVQAVRNGMGYGKKREGIVLRPLIELRKNNGERIICKHKGEEFQERKTKQKVLDPEKLKVLQDAETIAEEWVTSMRLTHVLDKIPGDIGIERTGEVIRAMIEDVTREAKGEIVERKEVGTAIGRKTAVLFKTHLKAKMKGGV